MGGKNLCTSYRCPPPFTRLAYIKVIFQANLHFHCIVVQCFDKNRQKWAKNGIFWLTVTAIFIPNEYPGPNLLISL